MKMNFASSGKLKDKKAIVFVGPSGSGKTTLINEIMRLQDEEGYSFPFGKFENIKSYTTKNTRLEDYIQVTIEEFARMVDNDELVEYTRYDGNYYGVGKNSIESLGDNIGIKAFDIVGVKSLKRLYGDKIMVIFTYRSTPELVASIMERKVSDAEKTSRISRLEEEQQNRFAHEVDGILKMDEGDLDATIQRFMHLVEAMR